MSNINARLLNILLIVPSYACTSKTGGGQRTLLIFNALKLMGKVDVLVLDYFGEAEFVSESFMDAHFYSSTKLLACAEIGAWRFFRPLFPNLLDKLARTFGATKYLYLADSHAVVTTKKLLSKSQYDVVVGRYLKPIAQSGILDLTNAPFVLDLDDSDDAVIKSKLGRRELSVIKKLALKHQLKQTISILEVMLPKFSHVWLASDSDLQKTPHRSKSVLPNIAYIPNNKVSIHPLPEALNSKVVLFVGAFAHKVNVEGIERFITHCWPKIKAQVTDATLRIVGSGGWEDMRQKYTHDKTINIIGFVEELEDEYQNAAFTVVPIFEGGGTKIKILESMFYQRTCLISHHAQYGYEKLQHRESLLVAKNEAELISGCVELLTNPNLRETLARNGHKSVVSDYSTAQFNKIVSDAIKNFS